MVYTGRDQAPRMGDPARAARDDQRTFARRIDCDSAPRPGAYSGGGRGGPRTDGGTWERSRTGYGR